MKTAETVVRAFRPEDMPALRGVLSEPDIVQQFDMYEGDDGAERLLGDPYTPAEGVRLAFADGAPAGFACAIVLPGLPPWAMLRGGVLPRFRRRGLGRALHDSVSAFVRAQTRVPGIVETAIAAWQPLEEARALAERLGYRHDRWFWLMRRERGSPPPAPSWPDGVHVRAFDGGDAMLADWTEVYNASFSENYRFVPSPPGHAREIAKKPGFRADGLLLAYRGGSVVGFCRNELHARRAEIGTLGTIRSARGTGLGRALLRWGVGWIERETALPVTLMVDGENEGALGLYRSEGFQVTHTRRIWARPVARA